MSLIVDIDWILLGWWNPIAIQSMTNTDTSNIEDTYNQIIELNKAWSELVRITINDKNSAKWAIAIINKLRSNWINTPIIWDFHFNWHILLSSYPELAELLAKYRINPWNIGSWNKKDDNSVHGLVVFCKGLIANERNCEVLLKISTWMLSNYPAKL